MHSSCIVVMLDWAAGLPAWLIRRFGFLDLTRKTLFTSQKHQSHSSWDLNEDSWPTLSMNIYQVLYIAGPCTKLDMQGYWQDLGRLCYQCHFVVSSLELQSSKSIILPLTSQSCWDHCYKLAGNPVSASATAASTTGVSKPLLSVAANCKWPRSVWASHSLRVHLPSYIHIYLLHRSDFISVQCTSSVFLPVTETFQDVNQICHIPAWIQPSVSSFSLACAGSSLWL